MLARTHELKTALIKGCKKYIGKTQESLHTDIENKAQKP